MRPSLAVSAVMPAASSASRRSGPGPLASCAALLPAVHVAEALHVQAGEAGQRGVWQVEHVQQQVDMRAAHAFQGGAYGDSSTMSAASSPITLGFVWKISSCATNQKSACLCFCFCVPHTP